VPTAVEVDSRIAPAFAAASEVGAEISAVQRVEERLGTPVQRLTAVCCSKPLHRLWPSCSSARYTSPARGRPRMARTGEASR
jgi:hypothetical protein